MLTGWASRLQHNRRKMNVLGMQDFDFAQIYFFKFVKINKFYDVCFQYQSALHSKLINLGI